LNQILGLAVELFSQSFVIVTFHSVRIGQHFPAPGGGACISIDFSTKSSGMVAYSIPFKVKAGFLSLPLTLSSLSLIHNPRPDPGLSYHIQAQSRAS
jgi:hypothetical protein